MNKYSTLKTNQEAKQTALLRTRRTTLLYTPKSSRNFTQRGQFLPSLGWSGGEGVDTYGSLSCFHSPSSISMTSLSNMCVRCHRAGAHGLAVIRYNYGAMYRKITYRTQYVHMLTLLILRMLAGVRFVIFRFPLMSSWADPCGSAAALPRCTLSTSPITFSSLSNQQVQYSMLATVVTCSVCVRTLWAIVQSTSIFTETQIALDLYVLDMHTACQVVLCNYSPLQTDKMVIYVQCTDYSVRTSSGHRSYHFSEATCCKRCRLDEAFAWIPPSVVVGTCACNVTLTVGTAFRALRNQLANFDLYRRST